MCIALPLEKVSIYMSLIAVSPQTHRSVTFIVFSVFDTDNAGQEFESRTVSWLFAGPFAAEDMTDADVGDPGADPNAQGHGTCMASIAMGNKDGVARKSSLTVVRSDIFSNNNADSAAEIWIDALAKVHEDVIKNNAQSKAVVSMSFGVHANPDQDYTACFSEAMLSLLLELDKQDIPAVAAVANEGIEIDTYPALLAKPGNNGVVPVPNLVVVGGALTDGNFDSDIRDPEIKIYGPSDDQSGGTLANPGLECASRDGIGYHRGERGISHGKSDISHKDSTPRADSTYLLATAAVAGMIAYFMGEGNSGAASRHNLFNVATKHVQNGPPMLNNDVDGTSPN